MRIVLIGPPGAGKGTQGTKLAACLGVPHIASGDILRRIIATEDSELARAARVINEGRLISDEVAAAIVFRELEKPESANGFVLDGYPRNIAQAQVLDDFLARRGQVLDAALALEVDLAVVVDRLSNRLTCPRCGESYHLRLSPPRTTGVCDVCGYTPLEVRADDAPDKIGTRLRLFHERTEPVLSYYRDRGALRPVSAEAGEEEVFAQILKVLGRDGTPAAQEMRELCGSGAAA